MMDKNQAIRIISECAKKYDSNLLNKNLLIIFDNKSKIDYIEILFEAHNFLHFTGIEKPNKISATDFLKLALNSKLPTNSIKFKSNGTTQMKLDILKDCMNIDKKARMIGDYDNSKLKLQTDKLVGHTSLSIGVIKNKNAYYAPNTLLKEDIRNISLKPTKRILAIYKKDKLDKSYSSKPTFIAKNMDISNLPNEIIEKLN